MKKKKSTTLIFSLCALIVCSSIAVGVSYGLFSSSSRVNNHLQIKENASTGELKATLKRVSGSKDVSNSSGTSYTSEKLEEEDFTNSSSSNVFGLSSSDYTIAGCKYIANMKLTNTGDMDFTFNIKLTNTEDKTNTSSFQDELKVSYGKDESSLTEKGSLTSVLTSESSLDSGTLIKSASYDFSVEIEFPKGSTTKSGDVYFDLLVEITSAVETK